MSDEYPGVAGFVQKFGDKPAVTERDANGQKVRGFTIKAFGSQKLVSVTVWPEFAAVKIGAGDVVFAEGKFKTSGDNNQFLNLSASKLAVIPGAVRVEAEVVNAAPASSATSDDSPF